MASGVLGGAGMHRRGSGGTREDANTSSPADLVGRLVGGRYRIGPLLGSGAMGRVHLATHVALGRACAIKVIGAAPEGGAPSAQASPAEATARFRAEAIAASRLDHPNVLRVLDYGREPDGLSWLVTEHLEGEDLVDVLGTAAPLSTARVATIGRQVCAVLHHVHAHGIVHRDVKPENVRLVQRQGDDGRTVEVVKLVDFGTAWIALPDVPVAARADEVIGTPAYMSPEQVTGMPVDARSDVYACGVLLFEMATGRLPFVHATPYDLAIAHVERAPPSARSVHPGVDPELAAVIAWCLRKDAAERPQSARELRDALGLVAGRTRERARPAALADTARIGRASLPSAPIPLTRRTGEAPHRPAVLPPAPDARPRRSSRLAGSIGLALLATAVTAGAAWVLVADGPRVGESPFGTRRAIAATATTDATSTRTTGDVPAGGASAEPARATAPAPAHATSASPDAGPPSAASAPTPPPERSAPAPAPRKLREAARHAAPRPRAAARPAPVDDDDPYAPTPARTDATAR